MTDNVPDPTLISLVLPSLVPCPALPASKREAQIVTVANDLQHTGGTSDLTSAMVFIHLGHEYVDRVAEILGRIGSAGEQLGLALATNRDARRWTASDAVVSDAQYATMGVRAQAEVTAMWTLSAAHGLANALVRLLLLHEKSRTVIETAFPKAQGFPPYSEEPDAWVSFEPKALKAARQAAAGTSSPAAELIAETLSKVFGDNRWSRFLDLRNVGFHRWRPQSVDGGTPKQSSLKSNGLSHSITVGVGPTNEAPTIEEVLKVAENGLDLFSAAARVFDDNVHSAINELTNKKLFATPST